MTIIMLIIIIVILAVICFGGSYLCDKLVRFGMDFDKGTDKDDKPFVVFAWPEAGMNRCEKCNQWYPAETDHHCR